MSATASPEAVQERPAIREIAGIRELADKYQGFILDQWGVLHDGTTPYAGAADCLRRLRQAGKRIVILSNSGRREAENIRLMESTGFARDLYDRIISAGEDAREALERRERPFHAKLGRRYFAFLRDGKDALLEGLPLERVQRVEDAEFIVVIGIDSPRRTVASYEADLARGAKLGLPMVCANPDIVRVSPEGLVDAPGALARRYEELGGQVMYHGKPWPAIYESCLRTLGCPREQVVAVGDSLDHDVLGASRAGLPCAFVAGGIHLPELGGRWGEAPDAQALRKLLDAAPARPAFVVPAFTWSGATPAAT